MEKHLPMYKCMGKSLTSRSIRNTKVLLGRRYAAPITSTLGSTRMSAMDFKVSVYSALNSDDRISALEKLARELKISGLTQSEVYTIFENVLIELKDDVDES